jgi:hypothetical protein
VERSADGRDVVTIPGSPRNLALIALVANLAIGSGLYKILGQGPAFLLSCSVAVGLSALVLAFGAVKKTQRLELTREGFTNYNLFGLAAQRRAWTDVDGSFAVIRIGLNEAVAYRLTEASKKPGKPSPFLSGYDEAIPALFPVSAQQLALLLNNHKHGIADSRVPGGG